MKTKYNCFVDFGLEHVSILIAQIENNQLIDVPLILNSKIDISANRPQSAMDQTENFETLLKLISEAEKRLHTYIFSIILVAKNKAIHLSFIRRKLEFKKQQKISQTNREKLSISAIKIFNEQTNNRYNILDIIYNNFILDEKTIVKNPYKMLCNSLILNATMIGIKKTFTANISSSLERLKLHIKHYISSCVATMDLLKNSLPVNGNFLLIDIGSSSTEYCILHNSCIVCLDLINLGGLDMTRDIASEMKWYINNADSVKKKIGNYRKNMENSKDADVIENIENIANERLREISTFVLKTINNKEPFKNTTFKKIYIFGGVSIYRNSKNIISDIFGGTNVEILNVDNILNNSIIDGKIKEKDIKFENLQLFSALNFYINNLNIHKNARHGFLFKIPSKISCFLKDILY